MMRTILVGAMMFSLASCDSMTKAPDFSIREITSKSDETEYAKSITYEVNILARGDASAKEPYVVLIEVRQLSGGDPEKAPGGAEYGYVPVVDGIGHTPIGNDYRNKKSSISEAATWPPPKYSVRIIGYTPVKRIETPAVSN
jgi:hypothetical protein